MFNKLVLIIIVVAGLGFGVIVNEDWATFSPATLHFCQADEMKQNAIWNDEIYGNKPITACKRLLHGKLEICTPDGCVFVAK